MVPRWSMMVSNRTWNLAPCMADSSFLRSVMSRMILAAPTILPSPSRIGEILSDTGKDVPPFLTLSVS